MQLGISAFSDRFQFPTFKKSKLHLFETIKVRKKRLKKVLNVFLSLTTNCIIISQPNNLLQKKSIKRHTSLSCFF